VPRTHGLVGITFVSLSVSSFGSRQQLRAPFADRALGSRTVYPGLSA
jgi:hypothetical protein